MCLAIPAKITELEEDGLATVDILGVTRQISVDLTPQVGVGEYVLVHAGFAIEVVDEQFAQETIDLIREFPDLVENDMISGPNAPLDASPDAGYSQGSAMAADDLALLTQLAEEI